MEVTTAYLIKNPDPTTKRGILLVGGQWSPSSNGYFLTKEQKDRLDSGDIPEPKLPDGVMVNNMIDVYRISGNTYGIRHKIKAIGGRWNPGPKAWDVPVDKATYEDIVAALT